MTQTSKRNRTSVALQVRPQRRGSNSLGSDRPASPRLRTTRHPAHATSELIDVVNLVTQAFWAELRRSGERIEMSQWSTLKHVSRAPCTMSELARYKGVGLPTISKSVDMLVRRGWVERWIDKADRRQTLVRLTPSGRRLLTSCRRALEAFLDRRLAALAPSERDALDGSMRLVRQVLTSDEAG